MKLVTKVLTVLTVALLLLTTAHIQTASAVILDQSENFNDGHFADNAALFAAGYSFSDLSGLGGGGLDGAQLNGDPDGTDGVDDGGVFLDGFFIGETVTYQFAGTIEIGAKYMFGANLFQSSTSGVDADVELLANGVVVASQLKQGRIFASIGGAAPISLFYRGDPSTAGQTLSFRVRQVRGNDESFDVGIDNWALINRDLATPIASQFETFTGSVPFGYTWSLGASNGNGGYYEGGVNNPATPANGAYPGDAAADGAIFANGNNGGSPTSFVEYRFDGVIENSMQYNFDAFLYQSSTSFGQTNVELVADPGGPNEAVVATVFHTPVNGQTAKDFGSQFQIVGTSYTGDVTRAGQELAFRISSARPAGGGSSDVAIDGWSLNVFNPNVPLAAQFDTFSLGAVPSGYTFSAAGGGYATNDPLTPTNGANPGDAAADGAIFVNGNLEAIPPDPLGPPTTVTHNFLGKIEDGQGYLFSTYLYQSSTSFAESTIELIADLGGANEAVVASLFQSPVNGNSGGATPDFNPVSLSFTGDASLAGKSLSFRISSQRGAGVSSDVGIDGWSLSLISGTPGDYNGDGFVDAADYTVWRDNLGGDGSALLNRDPGQSGPINAGDYAVWKSNFGASGSGSLTAAAVPEPSSIVVLLFVMTAPPMLGQRLRAAVAA